MNQEADLNEFQMAKHNLMEIMEHNGKAIDLDSKDFILILMDEIRINHFFKSSNSLKEIKDQTILQKEKMIKYTKQVEKLSKLITKINIKKMLQSKKSCCNFKKELLNLVDQLEKNIEGNNLINQLNNLLKNPKNNNEEENDDENSCESDDCSNDNTNSIPDVKNKLSNRV